MNKLRTTISALTLAIAIFSLSSNAFAIGAAPLRVQVQGAPGETLETMVRAQNTEDSDKLVVLTKGDFFVREDESLQFIYEYDENNKHSMQNWIEFLENDVPIKANNVVEIPYKINIPEDAQPGGYYGTVFVGSKDALAQDVAGVGIQTVVAQLVLVEVTGGLKTDLEVQNININEQNQIETTVFNKGNTHDATTGKLIITNSKIELIEELKINKGLSNSLPDRPLTFANPWDRSEYEPGLYYAYLDAETEQTDALDAELKFEILKDGTLKNLKLTKGRSYEFAKLTFSDFPIIPIVIIGFELLVALLYGISRLFNKKSRPKKTPKKQKGKKRKKLFGLFTMLAISCMFTGSVLAQDSATITVSMTVKGPCDWSGAPYLSTLTVHDGTICEINGAAAAGPATGIIIESNAVLGLGGGTLLVGNIETTDFVIAGNITNGGKIEIGDSVTPTSQSWDSTLRTNSAAYSVTVAGDSVAPVTATLETIDTGIGAGINTLKSVGNLFAGTPSNSYGQIDLNDASTTNTVNADLYVFGTMNNAAGTLTIGDYTYVRESGAVDGTFTNDGTFNTRAFDSGYDTYAGGITTNNGTMTLTADFHLGHSTVGRDGEFNNNGTLNLGVWLDATTQPASGFLHKYGELNNGASGSIVIDNPYVGTGCTGTCGGTFNIGTWGGIYGVHEGGTLTNEGSFDITTQANIDSIELWGGTINNNGTGTITTDQEFNVMDKYQDSLVLGILNNEENAVITADKMIIASNIAGYYGGTVTNYGTIYTIASGESFYLGASSDVYNYGTIDLNNTNLGYLYIHNVTSANFTNGDSTLANAGTVTADRLYMYQGSGTLTNNTYSDITITGSSYVLNGSVFNNYSQFTSPTLYVGLSDANQGGTMTNGTGGDLDIGGTTRVYRGYFTNAAGAADMDVFGQLQVYDTSGIDNSYFYNYADSSTVTTGSIVVNANGELHNTGDASNTTTINSLSNVTINADGKYYANAFSSNDFDANLIINAGTYDATAATAVTDVALTIEVLENTGVNGTLTNDGTLTTTFVDIGNATTEGGILNNNGTFTIANAGTDSLNIRTDGVLNNALGANFNTNEQDRITGTFNNSGTYTGTEVGNTLITYTNSLINNFGTMIITGDLQYASTGNFQTFNNGDGGANTGLFQGNRIELIYGNGGVFNNNVGSTAELSSSIYVYRENDSEMNTFNNYGTVKGLGAANPELRAGLESSATRGGTFNNEGIVDVGRLNIYDGIVNNKATATQFTAEVSSSEIYGSTGTGLGIGKLINNMDNEGVGARILELGIVTIGAYGQITNEGTGTGNNEVWMDVAGDITIETNGDIIANAYSDNDFETNLTLAGGDMTVASTATFNVTNDLNANQAGTFVADGTGDIDGNLIIASDADVTLRYPYAIANDEYDVHSIEIQSGASGTSTLTVDAEATIKANGTHAGCQNTTCSLEIGTDTAAGASSMTVDGTLTLPDASPDGYVEIGKIDGTATGSLTIEDDSTMTSPDPDLTAMFVYNGGTFTVDGTATLSHPLDIYGDFIADTTDLTNALVTLQDNLWIRGTTGTADQGLLSTVTVAGSTTDVYGDYELDGTLNSGHLTVYSGGLIHSSGDDETSTSTNFYINADNLDVQSGGAISSDGVSSADRTGSTTGGGSHGGEGIDTVGPPTATSGTTKTTTPDYGESGENTGTLDGKGGGGINIFADGNVTVNGTISANGAAGTTSSGAGGTVIITQTPANPPLADVTTAFFIGSNNITADGGSGTNPGGGGRIVLNSPLIDDPDFSSYDMGEDGGSVHAYGGSNGGAHAAAGTVVYLGDRHNTDDTLIIDQGINAPTNGTITDLTDNDTFDRIEVDNGIAELGTTAYQTCFNLNTSTLYIARPPTGTAYTCTSLPDKPDSLHIEATWIGTTDTTLTQEPGYVASPTRGVGDTVYPIGDIGPVFAMYFRNPGDASAHDTVEIQVATDSAFGAPGSCTSCEWDATQGGTHGSITLAASVTDGTWTEDIEYAGDPLTKGITYYVRARFRNAGDSASGLWTHGDYNSQYKFTPTSYGLITVENCNDDGVADTSLVITQDGSSGGSPVKVNSPYRFGWGECEVHVSTADTIWNVDFGMNSSEGATQGIAYNQHPTNASSYYWAPIDNTNEDCTINPNGSVDDEEYGYNIFTYTNTTDNTVMDTNAQADTETMTAPTCPTLCSSNLKYNNSSASPSVDDCYFDIETSSGGLDTIIDVSGNAVNDGMFDWRFFHNTSFMASGTYTLDGEFTLSTTP